MFSKPLSLPLALGLFAAVLFFFCTTYYHSELFYGPRGIHDWAQADRLALAIGYYDDGMNFFRPSTLSEWSRERVTGVEAPLQAYVTAAIAKITGRPTLALVFRLVTLGICCAGALSLFAAAYRITKAFWVSAFTPLSLFCSPVYIAYGASFLPDAAALSLFFIGIAGLLRYFQNDRARTLAWAMAWLSVAALAKTTLVLFLLPIALWLGIGRLRRYRHAFLRNSWQPVLVTIAGLAAIGGWYLHAQALNKQYDSSLFLTAAQPFVDWNDVDKYFNHALKTQWLGEYFAWPQYGLLPVVLALGAASYTAQLRVGSRLWTLLLLCLLGSISAFCTMGHQLIVHDYYIVSMAFPLVGTALLVSCVRLQSMAADGTIRARRTLTIALGVALLFSFFFADFQFHRRISTDYYSYTPGGRWPGDWAVGGSVLLKQLRVPDTARILVAEEDPPNRALVQFDRKGIHMSEGVYGRGFGTVYQIAKEHGVRYIVWHRPLYERALNETDSAAAQHFDLLTPSGEKVVLRVKE